MRGTISRFDLIQEQRRNQPCSSPALFRPKPAPMLASVSSIEALGTPSLTRTSVSAASPLMDSISSVRNVVDECYTALGDLREKLAPVRQVMREDNSPAEATETVSSDPAREELERLRVYTETLHRQILELLSEVRT